MDFNQDCFRSQMRRLYESGVEDKKGLIGDVANSIRLIRNGLSGFISYLESEADYLEVKKGVHKAIPAAHGICLTGLAELFSEIDCSDEIEWGFHEVEDIKKHLSSLDETAKKMQEIIEGF